MGRNIRLEELLKTVDSSVKRKVDGACKAWRQRFHSFLSGDSRLKLSRGEQRVQIGISVRPGFPVSLGALQEVEIDEQAEHLARVRKQIECCKRDLEILIPHMEFLPGVSKEKEEYHQGVLNSMKTTREFLDFALKKVIIKAVVRKMLQVDRDILGVYKFKGNKGEIVLYWAVIGFIANSLGVKEEDLTAAVLAHELAHAYTHLGLDADGYQWKGFHDVSPKLAEPLAQYYTHLASKYYQIKSPGIWDAYSILLDNQTDTYRHHLDWVDACQPEVVRSVMLEARRKRHTDLAQFEPGLKRESSRLKDAGS